MENSPRDRNSLKSEFTLLPEIYIYKGNYVRIYEPNANTTPRLDMSTLEPISWAYDLVTKNIIVIDMKELVMAPLEVQVLYG